MWLGSPDGEAERGPMIARSYQEAFGRAPSDTESTSWFNFLASTAISYRDLVNAHIDWLVSPSGQVERPQVVDRSFEAVIARLPTLDERARWVARIVSERLTSKRIMALLRE